MKEPLKLITSFLNGKSVAYHSASTFVIQVGKGRGSYKTENVIVGSLATAVMQYSGINIQPGMKKRLLLSGSPNPVLVRHIER